MNRYEEREYHRNSPRIAFSRASGRAWQQRVRQRAHPEINDESYVHAFALSMATQTIGDRNAEPLPTFRGFDSAFPYDAESHSLTYEWCNSRWRRWRRAHRRVRVVYRLLSSHKTTNNTSTSNGESSRGEGEEGIHNSSRSRQLRLLVFVAVGLRPGQDAPQVRGPRDELHEPHRRARRLGRGG